MKKNTLKQLYTNPDTVWYAVKEDELLCQSSTVPGLDEGQHDFEWN